MPSLWIQEEVEESGNGVPGLQNSVYLTPEEAEGELVEFEMPGTMGTGVYIIEDVDLEAKQTIVKELANGEKYIIDDAFPPQYNHFNTPRLGSEHTLYWKEHLDGSGEWVRTTPKIERPGVAQIYHGHYKGHEKTRLVSKTHTYTPPGVISLDIWYSSGGLEVYYEPEIEGTDIAFNQVDVEKVDTFTQVGKLYIGPDNKVISYSIDMEYRKDRYSTPPETLDEYLI